ncbi:MAG: CDP-diacylglycerol--serine O-phosphatidyltransferase [Paramuribaculum sp.]|nr:CDP-diacylglycerol--serine O-phosphatidyltransferase [Paramuribaculum sp.]
MFRKIRANIPNSITCLNLLCGAMACICTFHLHEPFGALQGYQWAFIFIGAAALFDFLDGAMARLLHAYSDLGKELDSLSDLISFGLAPSMLMFNTINTFDTDSPWAFAALFIVLFAGLRLARFNVDDRQTTSFIGLPVPANAIFWIGTVAWIHAYTYPGSVALAILILVLASLMVMPIPMFSLKFSSFDWRTNSRRYILLAGAVLFVLLLGISGLAWTIFLYIAMSAVTPVK